MRVAKLNIKIEGKFKSSAYCTRWPTKAMVPEELPLRELLMMLLGKQGKRRMQNKTKSNDQVFSDYYDLISNTNSPKCLYESKRIMEKFRTFMGQFPPSIELAVQFLSRFQDRKLNTRARYLAILSAFFKWYDGEKLPLKIKTPKILPQYVLGEDIDKLITGIKGKKSHKKSIGRDVLLIETARMTGLRRGELAHLTVGDLNFNEDNPVLIVRGGKGAKDRSVSLNHYIKDRLAAFVKGKSAQESVFGLAPKTISMKIGEWAKKSGVPHLHTHSLRHYMATTLFERGANPRAVQMALGHESLDVTMRYAAVIGADTKKTMDLLEPAKEPDVIKLPSDGEANSKVQELLTNAYHTSDATLQLLKITDHNIKEAIELVERDDKANTPAGTDA